MKKLALPVLLLLAALASDAQKQFVIHGRIDVLSKCRNVRLSGYEPAPIGADGSFEIKGEVGAPSVALIRTDSSGAAAIWLEPGKYEMNCREITLPDIKQVLFRIPLLKGPMDAERYNDFQVRLFSGFGTSPWKGDPADRKAAQKRNAYRYMDSLLTVNNSSPVLAEMVRSVQGLVGDDTTKLFIQRLAPELKDNGDITMIENSFKRKEKIAREKTFENFSLLDMADKKFSLDSLTGKKVVLIDLWASDCGPCRADHPRLKEWYAKYAAKGLAIVSISIDENKERWLKAVRDDGIGNWANVCDTAGFHAALMTDYYIPYIPFRFLLDEKRTILVVGNSTDSWITEKEIAAALKE